MTRRRQRKTAVGSAPHKSAPVPFLFTRVYPRNTNNRQFRSDVCVYIPVGGMWVPTLEIGGGVKCELDTHARVYVCECVAKELVKILWSKQRITTDSIRHVVNSNKLNHDL